MALTLAGFLFLDKFFLKKIRRARKILPHFVERFFRIFSFIPFIFVVFFLIPLVFVFKYLDVFSIVTFFASCFLATGLAFLGKYFFQRERPFDHQTYLGKIDSAFPSAHTAGSFAAAFALALFWPPLAAPVFISAALVAFSRMYLELHFFSDVIGAIFVAYLTMALVVDSDLLLLFGF